MEQIKELHSVCTCELQYELVFQPHQTYHTFKSLKILSCTKLELKDIFLITILIVGTE